VVSKLVHESAAVVDDPLNAVGMEFTLVDQFATLTDGQKFAWLVTVIFVFDDVCYSFHNYFILAYQGLFVNSIMPYYPCWLDTQKYRSDIIVTVT